METNKLKRERGFIIAGIEKSRKDPEWQKILRKKLIEIDSNIELLQ